MAEAAKNTRKSVQKGSKKASERNSWKSRWTRFTNPHKDLSSILETAKPKAPLQDRILWLARLMSWVRGPTISTQGFVVGTRAIVRLRFLLQLLERQPAWRESLSAVVLSVLAETRAATLFSQIELTEQGGLFTEFIRRVFDRIMPIVPRPGELLYAMDAIFSSEDVEWLERIDADLWGKIVNTIAIEGPQLENASNALAKGVSDAMVNLTIQAAALALSSDVHYRLPSSQGASDAFVEANRIIAQGVSPSSLNSLALALDRCRESLQAAYDGIESSGVSLSLLYKLEALSALLGRLKLLVGVSRPEIGIHERRLAIRDFLVELARARASRRSVRRLLRMNLDIFARKLVEHAGETGEHYITRTPKEYWAMFRAGAGGGLVTVVTTFVKFMTTSLHMPLFFDGLFIALNYSASFVSMQLAGFALATKQPAMTAAALAEKLSTTMDRTRLGEFVDEVVRIARTQFIAVCGNVGLVSLGTWLVCFVYEQALGKTVLSAAYAEKTLHSFHLWESASALYAAIAGVLLWLSSLVAGWTQNWIIFRHIPEAIARQRRLIDILGEARTRRIADWIEHNATGLGGNISIGFMLAFAPVIGSFFGLPIDIRHVTLSSGQITASLMSMDPAALTFWKVAPAIAGVAMIASLNFGVSTALALIVAIRAKRVRSVWVRALLAGVGYRFLRHPLQFLFPIETSRPNVPTSLPTKGEQ